MGCWTKGELQMCRASSVGLAFVGLVAIAAYARGSVAAQQTFTLATDPTEVVLRLSFLGNTLPTRIEYTLYGDGRLEKVVTDAAYPTRRREVFVTDEEMHGLVRSAVLHGLASTGQEELTGKMRAVADKARKPGELPSVIPPPA